MPFCLFIVVTGVATVAGSGTAVWVDGVGSAACFNNPFGVSVDAYGAVFVSDSFSHMIRKISSAGEELLGLWI